MYIGVKLITKGAKEIIVLDEIQFETVDELLEDLSIGHPPGQMVLNWANGIIFHHISLPWTDVTAKEYIENGRIYWSALRYAPMKEYKDRISKNNVLFLIRKVRTPILLEVTKILREKIENKNK